MKKLVLKDRDNKNAEIMRSILELCINKDYSLAEISRELSISIPTTTKLVGELVREDFLVDMGKKDASNGRRPSIYGLSPSAGYLIGVEVGHDVVSIAIANFKGQFIDSYLSLPFTLDTTEESLKGLTDLIKEKVGQSGISMDEVLSCGISLSGRINTVSGYSFTYFISEDKPLDQHLESYLGVPVLIENDSRAMAYGEYLCGETSKNRNILFFNVGWGLGMGMVIDGKLYYGKSGFSGEIGHFPMLSNDRICQCGKVGCLETGASGSALHRMILEKLKEGRSSCLSEKYASGEVITLDDILHAILEEDILAIEVVEQVGTTLGRAIAGAINVFNPELVIIGGKLSSAKDYIMLQIRSSVNKYSLNIVSRDSMIKLSKLGELAGPIGACLLSRGRLLGLL